MISVDCDNPQESRGQLGWDKFRHKLAVNHSKMFFQGCLPSINVSCMNEQSSEPCQYSTQKLWGELCITLETWQLLLGRIFAYENNTWGILVQNLTLCFLEKWGHKKQTISKYIFFIMVNIKNIIIENICLWDMFFSILSQYWLIS